MWNLKIIESPSTSLTTQSNRKYYTSFLLTISLLIIVIIPDGLKATMSLSISWYFWSFCLHLLISESWDYRHVSPHLGFHAFPAEGYLFNFSPHPHFLKDGVTWCIPGWPQIHHPLFISASGLLVLQVCPKLRKKTCEMRFPLEKASLFSIVSFRTVGTT